MLACKVWSKALKGSLAVQGPKQQRTFTGTGADDDIVVASARGYVSALNKLIGFISSSNRLSAAERSMDSIAQSSAEPQQMAMVA